MAITINGSANTVAGLAVGGLPDGVVDNDSLANTTITASKIAADTITASQIAANAVGDSELNATTGKILQVVFASTTSNVTTSTTTWTDTGLTGDITPQSGSKVLVVANQSTEMGSSSTWNRSKVRLLRGSTVLVTDSSNVAMWLEVNATYSYLGHYTTRMWLDTSPGGDGSTAITYHTEGANYHNSGEVQWQLSGNASFLTLYEIGS